MPYFMPYFLPSGCMMCRRLPHLCGLPPQQTTMELPTPLCRIQVAAQHIFYALQDGVLVRVIRVLLAGNLQYRRHRLHHTHIVFRTPGTRTQLLAEDCLPRQSRRAGLRVGEAHQGEACCGPEKHTRLLTDRATQYATPNRKKQSAPWHSC